MVKAFLSKEVLDNDDDHNLYLGDFTHPSCSQSYGFSSSHV